MLNLTPFIPMGSKEAKNTKDGGGETIFSLYSLGAATNRDILVYSFNPCYKKGFTHLLKYITQRLIGGREGTILKPQLMSFVDMTDSRIKWTHRVKQSLAKLEPSGNMANL